MENLESHEIHFQVGNSWEIKVMLDILDTLQMSKQGQFETETNNY